MRRIALVLFIATVCASALFAQNVEPSNRPMFGLKVGIDFNMPGKLKGEIPGVPTTDFKAGVGATVGGVCNIMLTQGLFLEPGVSLFIDQYRYNANSNSDESCRKFGIRVPVVLGYAFYITEKHGMWVYTGPEFNYAFVVDYADKNSLGAIDGQIFGRQRRADCSWRIGIGIPVSSFLISLEGSLGITNLMKDPDLSFRENRLTLGCAYYF